MIATRVLIGKDSVVIELSWDEAKRLRLWLNEKAEYNESWALYKALTDIVVAGALKSTRIYNAI